MSTTISAEQAVAQLYDEYAPSVLRYLGRLTSSREEAEDIAQETFLKALRHWGQLGEGAHVQAWLFRIARNTAYDSLRRGRRAQTVLLSGEMIEQLPAPDQAARVGDAEPILAALRHLPDSYRVPLLLHSVAGYPLNEIAAALGWKLGTVKSRLHRARARFRAHYAGP
jgi:RNA polymerase sigma-70 factor (ECF subfamily)